MGTTLPIHPSSQTSSLASHIQISQQNWLLLQKPTVNVTQMGSFAIYKNKITGEIARQYTVHFDCRKEFEIYLEEFNEWRSQSHWNIIQSKYIVSDKEAFSFGEFCSSHFQVKLFVQNPVVALSEIKDIPPSESFYILLSTLVGFQHLFEVFGYFPLRENMITINESGIIKVWVNTDLSKNRPVQFSFINVSVEDMQNPTRFILELVQLIDNNTDYGQVSVSFLEFIHTKCDRKGVLTFSNCRKFLLNFAEENRIDIPDSLMSILDLLFQKTNRQEASSQNGGLIEGNGNNLLYGKQSFCGIVRKYVAGGYLLDNQEEDGLDEEEYRGHGQSNKFNSSQQAVRPSRNELIQSFQHSSHPQQQISQQVHRIIQATASHQAQTPSQSSQHLSSRQMSYNTLTDLKNIPGFQSQSQTSPLTYEQRGHYHHHSHGLIYSEGQKFQIGLNVVGNIDCSSYDIEPVNDDNPYHSLVQREVFQLQSTIREEAEEDSFLTSHKNSKFQTSRDLRHTSNHLKKTYKHIQTHRQTFSSHSESKLNIQNFSPRQIQVREDSQTRNQQELTKRSQKSIQFYTPSEIKELDAQIAKDLQIFMMGQVISY